MNLQLPIPPTTPWERATTERNWLVFAVSPANGGKRSKHPTGTIPSQLPHERRNWGDVIAVEDAAVWTHAEACAHLQRLGDGYMLGYLPRPDSAMVVGDLDDCVDPLTGQALPWAREIIDLAPTYCEVSTSGTGLRLLMAREDGDDQHSSGEANGVGLFANGGRGAVLTGRTLEGRTEVLPATTIKRVILDRKGTSSTGAQTNQDFDDVPPTYEDFATALTHLPNDGSLGYDDWIKVGYLMKDCLGETGRDLFLWWSQQYPTDPDPKRAVDPVRLWERGLKRPSGAVRFGTLSEYIKRAHGGTYPAEVASMVAHRQMRRASAVMPPVSEVPLWDGLMTPPVTPVEQPDAYISHDIFIYRHDRRGDFFHTIPPEELAHHDVPTLLTLSDAEIDERRAQVHIEQGWTPGSQHVLQSATWTAHEVETAAYIPTFPDPATLPRRPWLVNYFNQRGYLTGVIGAPGVSKTMFLIALGMHLASGRNYGGLTVAGSKPLRVLIVLAEEDPLEINLRMAAAAEHFGIRPDAMADRIAVMPMEGARRFNIGRSNGRVFEYDQDNVEFIGKMLDRHQVDMVLADPLGKLHDGEENDNVQMKQIARRLTQIAQEKQIGMVLAHHTPKLQGGEIAGNMWAARGASAIAAEFKVMNTLSTMTDEDADHVGVDRAERKRYCRRDDAKANNSLESSDVNWYERKSIILANGENVGVLVPKFFENVALKITPEIRNGFIGLVKQRLEDGDPIKVGTNHRNSGMVLMQYATGHDIEISDRACCRLVREWVEKGFLITEHFRFDRNTERLVLQPPKIPEYCGG